MTMLARRAKPHVSRVKLLLMILNDHSLPLFVGLCVGMSFFAFSGASPNWQWWNQDSKTFVHFADEQPSFKVKDTVDSNTTATIATATLRSIVESWCPALFKPFRPLWWLSNGHLQTMYCVMGDFSTIDRMSYDRTYLRTLEGGTIGLDCTPVDKWNDPEDSTPIIIVQHGLTGGSHEGYVRAVLSRATAPKATGGLGYKAVVVNFRGCAGVPITSQLLYSAGHTDDLRLAVLYIQSRFPNARLLGIGFSLGANVLSRYLAEEGEYCRLSSGCAVGCPWDLVANNEGLKRTFVGTHVYAKALGKNLQTMVRKHFDSLTRDPDTPVARAAREVVSLKSLTVEDFDHRFTSIAGGPSPRWPYPSAAHYYQDNSASKTLSQVRVPLLGINSADDPVVSDLSVQFSQNPMVVMATTTGGGHLGGFQEKDPKTGKPSRWFTEPILEWFKLMGEVVVDSPSHNKPTITTTTTTAEGIQTTWVTEEGRSDIGIREIEHIGIVTSKDAAVGNEGLAQGL